MIEREVGTDRGRTSAHRCDLRRCLVTPSLQDFKSETEEDETVRLWLVLEENPDRRDGYKIVYGEDDGMFGLAMRLTNGTDWFMGYYGTFLEAYDSM
ncbi:MAG: hypothetical protein ACYSU0_09495 [Planctomycetota bacterium]